MSIRLKEFVFCTLRQLLVPIIKILLRNGITHKEFCTLSKTIFVEVAAHDFGLRGRPTNISRIALLTGIDRKEVKRLQDLMQEKPSTLDLPLDRFTRLLSAWHLDEEFLDEHGLPNILPIEGTKGSFTSLIKRYGGDMPLQAFLKELLRAGVIMHSGAGHLKILQRYFIPASSDPDALLRAGSVIQELSETLFHNLYECQDNNKKIPRFERRASNNWVDPKHQKAFKAFVDKEGQAFLERVDEWLNAHEIKVDYPSNELPIRLGVGVYAIHQLQDNKKG